MNKPFNLPSGTNANLAPDLQKTARLELAAALRWAAKFGFHEGTCNHFSALMPGMPDCYLINPFGIHFSEMRASDLLVLDASGQLIEGRGEVETTAFQIHSAVHRANPKAVAVLHTHMPYATAITSLKRGRLQMCHQNAVRFHGRVAYDDDTTEGYQGLALGSTESARMVKALGDKAVLMLQSHGPLVVGPSIAQAFDDLYYLERAAQVQVLAASMGQPLAEVDPAVAARTSADFLRDQPIYARRHFDALQRMLDREDPSWRT
jgi:ribulose-5-phosphate 4-epimerase/fuculose-1-phosphate aldolase